MCWHLGQTRLDLRHRPTATKAITTRTTQKIRPSPLAKIAARDQAIRLCLRSYPTRAESMIGRKAELRAAALCRSPRSSPSGGGSIRRRGQRIWFDQPIYGRRNGTAETTFPPSPVMNGEAYSGSRDRAHCRLKYSSVMFGGQTQGGPGHWCSTADWAIMCGLRQTMAAAIDEESPQCDA